jgi:hypothetical protein
MAANGMQPVTPAFSPNALSAPIAAAAPSNDVGELDEPAPAHPAAKKPAAKKPAAASAKKAPAKLTLRNAPF